MDNKTKELELLLNEFFTLEGNNPKRTELDKFLTNYKSQAESFEHAKYYLVHSTNNYVLWFSLLVIEHKVCKAWYTMAPQDQNDTKTYLYETYLKPNNQFPTFINAKLGQILADIGRNEFSPTSATEYISNIANLIRNPVTSLRGVNLLQYISEEFLTTKHFLPQQKKNELKKLLILQVPLVISVLTEYLSNLFAQNAEKKLPFKNNNNNLSSIAHFAVGSPDTNTYTGSFSNETKLLTKAVFDALTSYFQWIPLNELLTPVLLDVLFKYLRLDNNSIPALMCLNEILSKNCVPKEFEEFLMRIFHQIFSLMTDIIANPNLYNSDFLNKFTQFINLFVSNHLRRVENNPNFPISDFLSLLFQYSFLQPSSESFLSCIEIWNKFLDYLITQSTEKSQPAPTKYTDGLLLFQSELVKRTLFSFSKNILSQIDDEEEDIDEEENVETKFDNYIKQCIEVVAKITELYPNKSLENLYPLFTENVTSFFGKTEETIKQGLIMDQNDETLNNLVKDITTILFLFSRLANQFVLSFGPTYIAANFIFQKLLDMCSFSNQNKTFKFGEDWEKLQLQLLNTIRSFNYWLLEYGNQVRTVPSQQPDFDNSISKLITVIGPLFSLGIPEEISICAGKLLMTLVVVSKPINLLQLMDNMIAGIHQVCGPLSPGVQSIIFSAISCTILIPPSNVNLSHQWDVRRPKYSPFIKGITSGYLELKQIPGFIDAKIYDKPEVVQRVHRTLKILKGIIRSVPDLSMAKGILHDAIQDTLPMTLELVGIYSKRPDVLEIILDFFLTLFEQLKTQVGIVFLQQTIAQFIDAVGGGDNLNQMLMNSQTNPMGSNMVSKLLQILAFAIQTSGNSFESLLTNTVDFAMDKIYPCIVNSTSPVLPYFFTLLHCILDNQWKHLKANQTQRLLLTFQNSFCHETNVNLFKQNLDAFEKLKTKVKLYDKIAQMEHIFGCTFITVFFDILIANQQSVQNEDIINTIYHFASVNFDKFFQEFLNSYLLSKQITNEQKSKLLSNFTMDKDQPTFNANMNQFINDYCFYSYLNNNTQ
ncbi:exportin 6 [Tieghemostelium lacteum]|uniref:Exportin 6 n=1 Tax=Tieghemostelium lacteum TaxID=361077 RepID=A0A151ZAQ3_TIELA|nr:exportin 6 [Tieghemostelium lacteum]|eukprot:KYQ91032.1 exportin 6 [Tieghemostelium lacteum]